MYRCLLFVAMMFCIGCGRAPEGPPADQPKEEPVAPPAPPKVYEPIDPATVRAWWDRGFAPCWLTPDASYSWIANQNVTFDTTRLVPGFRPINEQNHKNLPPVAVPFGLDLASARGVDDTVAKELPALKNLVVLRIGDSGITDAGVVEVTKIQSLTALEMSECRMITERLSEKWR